MSNLSDNHSFSFDIPSSKEKNIQNESIKESDFIFNSKSVVAENDSQENQKDFFDFNKSNQQESGNFLFNFGDDSKKETNNQESEDKFKNKDSTKSNSTFQFALFGSSENSSFDSNRENSTPMQLSNSSIPKSFNALFNSSPMSESNSSNTNLFETSENKSDTSPKEDQSNKESDKIDEFSEIDKISSLNQKEKNTPETHGSVHLNRHEQKDEQNLKERQQSDKSSNQNYSTHSGNDSPEKIEKEIQRNTSANRSSLNRSFVSFAKPSGIRLSSKGKPNNNRKKLNNDNHRERNSNKSNPFKRTRTDTNEKIPEVKKPRLVDNENKHNKGQDNSNFNSYGEETIEPPSKKDHEEIYKEYGDALNLEEIENHLNRVQNKDNANLSAMEEMTNSLEELDEQLQSLSVKVHLQTNKVLRLNTPIVHAKLEAIQEKYSHLFNSK